MAPPSRSPSLAALASILPLFTLVDALYARDGASTCSGLVDTLSSNTTFTITNATYYDANATFDTSTTGGSDTGAGGAASFSGLPAFCRQYFLFAVYNRGGIDVHILQPPTGIQLDLNTYNGSNATAEVWMPDSSTWSGRFLAVGGGGLEGSSEFRFCSYVILSESKLKAGRFCSQLPGSCLQRPQSKLCCCQHKRWARFFGRH